MKSNNKIVQTIGWEGACRLGEKISKAKQDAIDWFQDDMGLEDQKDVFVNEDGWFSDFQRETKGDKFDPRGSIVYYLFEVGLTKGAQDKMLAENLIE